MADTKEEGRIRKMLMDEGRTEGREEGDYARAKKTALNMLKRNSSYEEVAEVLELPVSTIRSWEAEACTVV